MAANNIEGRPSKSRLRRQALARRRGLEPATRAGLSAAIQRHFLESRLFLASRSLGCYLAMEDEVETALIIERAWRCGKRLCVPVTGRNGSMAFVRLERDSRLVKNRFGLWEPADGAVIPPRKLDVVVTPLAAFDGNRNRIGMGGGFFDRHFAYLSKRDVWLRPKLVGLAFACQELDAIESDTWDVPVYRIIDERGFH